MFTENGSWFQVYWQVGIGWAAAAFVVVGMRLHRPDGALVWYLFAAGVFLNASGILAEAIGERVLHLDGYPTIADPLWLGLYPGLAGGMIMLIAQQVLNTGTVSATGGAGAAATAANAGGGGGGGGGVILVYTMSGWTAGTTVVTGGALGGNAGGTGSAGVAGGNGTVLNVVLN